MKKKRYSPLELQSAIDMYMSGKKMGVVRKAYPTVPTRTIYERARKILDDIPIRKPGPAPALTSDLESDLAAYVVGMQVHANGVTRSALLVKANQLMRHCRITTRTSSNLGDGWLRRFFERHPHLTLRASQQIKRARAEATEAGLIALHCEMMQHIIERKLTADRIFNMDETGYSQCAKNQKVVAVSGSRNVWGRVMEMSFHCTIVAAASAAGFVVPPSLSRPRLPSWP